MDYQSIYEDVKKACPKDAEFIELVESDTKKYYFVRMYRQTAFKITFGVKVSSIEIDSEYIGSPEEITLNHKILKDGTCRLYIDMFFNLDRFISFMPAVCQAKKLSFAAESFGCCNYFEDCSDAKHCLFEHDLDYLGCYYRKNLEAGRIFYGKNATLPNQ